MSTVVFVHGSGRAGAAAWPEQHLLAGRYDCLFLRRRGFETGQEDLRGDAEADARRFTALLTGHDGDAPTGPAARRLAGQQLPWEAPLGIVPGMRTLVVTGGWEPLYEEVAGFLASTGARHVVAGRDHRPQDSADGQAVLAGFLAEVERAAA
nr:hypothetical protein [Tersicoccus phoenicis]